MIQFIIAIVLLVITYLVTPRPKASDATANLLSDKDFPISTEQTPIPVIFGEVLLKQPNVVWWGDVKTRPISRDAGG